MHDVIEFLRRHDPFDGVDDANLERLARAAEVEFFPEGTSIFVQGAEPREHVWVIRRGAVELTDEGRPLDLLGEGELFGHPSMLSGRPTGLGARAAEDTLTYRLAAASVEPLLTRPAGLRFVAQSLLGRVALGASPTGGENAGTGAQPVAQLVREQPIVCGPDQSVRDTARRMAEESASCALVRMPDGFGIVTDQDLRLRVVAGDVPVDAPVREVMSHPAVSVTPDRLAADVMLSMLDRGIKHMPVITAGGDVLGIVTDVDLLSTQTRTPFLLRRAVTGAATVQDVRAVVSRLPATIVALHDAGVPASHLSGIMSVVADAMTRRLVEILLAEHGRPDLPMAWLALGSHGRREVVPGSDVDSAIVWADGADAAVEQVLADVASRTLEALASGGFASDQHGATARSPLFARSITGWQQAVASWLANPGQDKVLILVSVMFDSRVITGAGDLAVDVLGELRSARRRGELLRWLLRLALLHRPPTGFLRNIVVEHSGEHRGRFDIKRGGLLPVVEIARYASLAAGAPARGTRDRLQAAAAGGVLSDTDSRVLIEAHDLFYDLRFEHQVGQLRAGVAPNDFVDPSQLNPLTRRYVRDALRAVASVQRGLSNSLALE